MNYRAVEVVRRGSSEGMQIVEKELKPAGKGEVRVRVLAVGVCQDDIAARVGNRPFLPKVPFTPGYNIIGTVDQIGETVLTVRKGERVGALTVFGGYAEYVYLDAAQLVKVPENLEAGEAATLMLNYLVAYQILHRVAKVKAGQKALVIGASGGVGTAFLQLGKLAGLKMYGLASEEKHARLDQWSARLIDYHGQNWAAVLKAEAPGGMEYVFNGMGRERNEGRLAGAVQAAGRAEDRAGDRKAVPNPDRRSRAVQKGKLTRQNRL